MHHISRCFIMNMKDIVNAVLLYFAEYHIDSHSFISQICEISLLDRNARISNSDFEILRIHHPDILVFHSMKYHY
jgi:hypothetical protein